MLEFRYYWKLEGMINKEKTFSALEEKMISEIIDNHPYEALQLAESFIARKKKTLGRLLTSELLFHGCKVLVKGNASSSAGTLLQWYIEDGAGEDYYLRLLPNSEDNCTDLPLLEDFFKTIPAKDALPILEKIYVPFHRLAQKLLDPIKSKHVSILNQLQALEMKWVEIYLANQHYTIPIKALLRLRNYARVAEIVHEWALTGYPSEYSLYFARLILQLLSEGNITQASELNEEIERCKYMDKLEASSTEPPAPPKSFEYSLGVYHFAVIAVEMAAMEPKPRVDKPRAYLLLLERYAPILKKCDPRLRALAEKIGPACMEPREAGRTEDENPMAALLQNMVGGLGSSSQGPLAGGREGMDMSKVMKLISQLK
jgi:hypothetical protein